MPDLSTILTNVKNGIAKTNNYKITIPEFNLDFHGKGTQLPSSDLGVIEIPYKGRKLKVPGQRTFAEWTSTILNDENFKIRSVMEKWQNDIVKTNFEITSTLGNRSASTGGIAPTSTDGLYGTVEIFQLKEDGTSVVAGGYRLVNCWPSDISAIDLSYDTTDAVEDFTVTWTYDYFENGFTADGDVSIPVQTKG